MRTRGAGTLIPWMLLLMILFGWTSALVPPAAADGVEAGPASLTRSLAAAGLSDVDASELAGRLLSHRFNEEGLGRIQGIFSGAASERLPVTPLLDKAYEGMAKGIEPDRIMDAMDTVRQRYAFAGAQCRALGMAAGGRAALLGAMADGMTAGVRPEDVARIAEQLRTAGARPDAAAGAALAAESFRTARDMARLGVASTSVTDVVTGALRGGYDADGMRAMSVQFARDVRQVPAHRLAGRYAEAIAGGRRPGGANASKMDGPGGGRAPGDSGPGSSGAGRGGRRH